MVNSRTSFFQLYSLLLHPLVWFGLIKSSLVLSVLTLPLAAVRSLHDLARPQPREVPAAGVGKPLRHLLRREPRPPHEDALLVVVGIGVVLVVLEPRLQHVAGLGAGRCKG